MSLGKNIKALRTAKGWDQKTLSQKSGVGIGTISAIEVRNSVRSQFAPALAIALGVSVEQLLSDATDWLATGKGEMLQQRPTSAEAVAAASSASGAVTLAQALEVVAASLNELPDARRELAAQHLQTLARAPDSAKAMQSAIEAISANTTGQVAKVLSMKLTKESANLFNQEVQQDADSKL